MVNPSKQRGTAAETACVRWLRENGFPWADRQPLRGNRDAGDLTIAPGLIAEVKSHKSAATGQPGHKQLETWLEQTDIETLNAGAEHGVLIVKRAGTTNVGMWWAHMRLGAFLKLLGCPQSISNPNDPVHTSVASMAAILRARGYGQELETNND